MAWKEGLMCILHLWVIIFLVALVIPIGGLSALLISLSISLLRGASK